jgi:hypothetical protein
MIAALLRRASLLSLVAAVLGAQPATTALAATAEGVDPQQRAAIQHAADAVYGRELARLRSARKLNDDPRGVAQLRGAAEPIIAVAAKLRPEARDWQWAANVATDDVPLLYCLPGGKLMISTGFIAAFRPTPDELSALVAHVVAHALEGHDGDEAAARYLRAGPPDADPNRAALRMGEILQKLALSEPQLPEAETAADALSVELLTRGLVDPRAAGTAWRKVALQRPGRAPAFGALHGANLERVVALEAQANAAYDAYQKALREAPPPAPFPPPGSSPPRAKRSQ